jgi:hypothetical protein
MSPVPRSRLSGGRLLALTIGIPLVIAAGSEGAFTLVGLYAHASEHHGVDFPVSGGNVSLRTSSGSVTIVAGTGSEVTVSYTEHYQLKEPTVTSTATGGGVQLAAACPGGLLGSNCAVNYVITVPASMALAVHTGDGSVRSTGTTGVQSFDSGDGHISLVDVGGTVSATTGDGSIDITVPVSSGPYRVSASTGDGTTHVTIPDDRSAASSIDARSGDGSVTIGYAR